MAGRVALLLGWCAVPGLPLLAAEPYPARPIRWLLGSAAGSSPDLIARLLAGEMAQRLAQSILVDNRPGASGSLAVQAVAKAAPDGYTAGYVTPSFVLNRALQLPIPFDAERELEPVVQFGAQPLALVVAADAPYRHLGELLAQARGRPAQLSYASTGLGSIFHLAVELLRLRAGVEFTHVPYTSGPQALADVAAGRVAFMFNAVNAVAPHVEAGRLRALALTGRKRSAILPQVPTAAEQGLDGYEVSTWGGLVVPHRTPDEAVATLNRAANAALQAPSVRQGLEAGGYEIVGGTPGAFRDLLRQEVEKWTDLVQRAGIRRGP